jgi:DNA-directed RNA polymerase II subunit RPB2
MSSAAVGATAAPATSAHLYKECPQALVDHQIRSYNIFLLQLLPNIIREKISHFILPQGDKFVHVVQIINLHYSTTSLNAMEARRRKISYVHPAWVDARYFIVEKGKAVDGAGPGPRTVHRFLVQDHEYADLPIMTGALNDVQPNFKECQEDLGGYFVINGNERVIVSQEKLRVNRMFVKKVYKQQSYTRVYDGELRSFPGDKCRSTSNVHVILNHNTHKKSRAHVVVPFMTAFELPLHYCFRIFNVRKISTMRRMVLDSAMTILMAGQRQTKQNRKRMKKLINELLEEEREAAEDEGGAGVADTAATDPRPLGEAPEDIYAWLAQIHYKDKYRSDLQTCIRDMRHLFQYEVMPHLEIARRTDASPSSADADSSKAEMLAHMVGRVVLVALGYEQVDDIDDMPRKQVHTPGYIMALLVRQLHTKFMKNIRLECEKVLEKAMKHKNNYNPEQPFILPLADILHNHHKTITHGIRYCMSNGNFSVRLGGSAANGVCQQLTRSNISCYLSHARRINTQAPKSSKSSKTRLLRQSHRGFYDGTETPEGEACGLLKALALGAYIRIYYHNMDLLPILFHHLQIVSSCATSSASWPAWFYSLSTKAFNAIAYYHFAGSETRRIGHRVYLNAALLGVTYVQDVDAVLTRAQQLMDLPVDLLWRIDGDQIQIDSSDGTILRMFPGAAPETEIDRESQFFYTQLVRNKIRFKAADNCFGEAAAAGQQQEEESGELELGSMAAYIPFPHHNQAPRNIYQCSMGKQAISCFATNFQHRVDTLAHVLHYPQKPLSLTAFEQCIDPEGYFSAGINVIVLIANYSVFTDDDACVINEAAIQRGLFVSQFTRTYYDHEKRSKAENHCFEKPKKDIAGMRLGEYGLLSDADGLVDGPGCCTQENTALIGKVSIMNPASGLKKRRTKKEEPGLPGRSLPASEQNHSIKTDKSMLVKTDEPSITDYVYLTCTRDEQRAAGVRTLSTRVPEIGDKFSSRHGQKGVCALTVPQEDMPRTAEGISPDIIINPHCWTRMTIGAWIEMLTGKVACLEGKFRDATAFTETNVAAIGAQLHAAGFQKWGNEPMYCGMTGKRLEGRMFIGPCFYQRLRHFVVDKMHARARGPRACLTRQPVPGRARDGGLRVGEMETICLIVHGASGILRDRLFYVSDYNRSHVCKKCGLFLASRRFCHVCCSNDHIDSIDIPFATKLLIQELRAFHIGVRLIF